jgi:Holliday junction resolvase RusA-like endonuclease
MVILEVMLPLPPVQLSPRKRGGNWAVKRKAAAEYKDDCLACLLASKARGNTFSRVVLHYTLHTARLRNSKGRPVPDGLYRPKDIDNAIASLKYLQDAIVAAKIVLDDDSGRLSLGRVKILGEIESKGVRGVTVQIEAVE